MVVLVFSGGPGLSSNYLEPFRNALYSRFPLWNVRVIEMDSYWDSVSLENYSNLVDLVSKDLLSLDIFSGDFALIGHSFGGFLSLSISKILSDRGFFPDFHLLLRMPVSESTVRLDSSMRSSPESFQLITTEIQFKSLWESVLPLYFGRPVTSADCDLLLRNTNWICGRRALVGRPTAIELLDALDPKSLDGVIYFYSSGDVVLADEDLDILSNRYSRVRIVASNNSNHFDLLSEPQQVIEASMKEIVALCAKS